MSRGRRTNTIIDCSGVGAGGITRVLAEVVRHWPAGQRIQIVAAPASWELPAERCADVEIISRQTSSRSRTITEAAKDLRKATACAVRDRSQVTRVLSLSPSVAMLSSRLPVTTVVHDFAFRLWPRGLPASVRQYRRVSYGMAIRRSGALLCVSGRTQHDLFGLYGVPYERTRVWHPGSELKGPGRLPESLAQLKQSGGRYLVVAGHAPHKGVELAVEALADLPKYVLAVLTGGQRVERFTAAAARSGASDRILFLAQLSDAEYVATIADAAALLMPSHFEGYGLPVVEALRLGTPAVISPDPALFEAAGGAAIRMATWTATALREAVASIDDLPRPRPGETGRSWQEATDHLVALLVEAPQLAAASAASRVEE